MSATKRHARRRTAWSCIRRATTTRSSFTTCMDFIRTISKGSRNATSLPTTPREKLARGALISAIQTEMWERSIRGIPMVGASHLQSDALRRCHAGHGERHWWANGDGNRREPVRLDIAQWERDAVIDRLRSCSADLFIPSDADNPAD